MDNTDEDDLDLVPPSPIATTAQVSRSLAQNDPPLPRLFIPGSPVAGSSRSDLSPLATSTQQPGSSGTLLSPIATSTQQPGNSRSDLSPLATSTQQPGSSRSLISPIGTPTLTGSSGLLLSPVTTPSLQHGSSRYTIEPPRGKTNNLHRRKQRRRSVSR